MSKPALPMQRMNLQLPKADVDFIKQLGYGSLSAGVRRALSIARRSPGLDLACDTDLESDADADSDVVGYPAPQVTKPAKTKAAAPHPTPGTQPATKPTNILDIPLVRPQDPLPVVDDGPMDLGGMTSEAIKRELAQNRADAERAEQKQRHYDAAAQGKTAFVAPKGAHDGDDEPYVYNPEDYPASLR